MHLIVLISDLDVDQEALKIRVKLMLFGLLFSIADIYPAFVFQLLLQFLENFDYVQNRYHVFVEGHVGLIIDIVLKILFSFYTHLIM